jgi:hypothetical protein
MIVLESWCHPRERGEDITLGAEVRGRRHRAHIALMIVPVLLSDLRLPQAILSMAPELLKPRGALIPFHERVDLMAAPGFPFGGLSVVGRVGLARLRLSYT